MSAIVHELELRALIDGWLASGKLVVAPVEAGGRLLYQRLAASGDAVLESRARPANSIKEFLFPRHEALFRYRLNGKQVELSDAPIETREQILVAARPCDAASLPALDHIFDCDRKDGSFERARARTTVIALACNTYDEACFCTSVGLAPASEAGADVLLFDLGEAIFEVRVLTDKGRALFEGHTETSEREAPSPDGPPRKFDPVTVRKFLDGGFEDPLWGEETVACLGCGVCAYTCPACHCFDMVDEGNAAGGTRVRNWDSCQFPMFTRHASGHNPRSNQPRRQRQRIYHKFSIYPERFDALLCTGCGNCARNCPAGLGVLRVLEAIEDRVKRQDV
jgi:ferredoxin